MYSTIRTFPGQLLTIVTRPFPVIDSRPHGAKKWRRDPSHFLQRHREGIQRKSRSSQGGYRDLSIGFLRIHKGGGRAAPRSTLAPIRGTWVYSILPAAGPTPVACLVLGSMPISATPPTPSRPTVTTCPRALKSACTASGRVLGTERLPSLARSCPNELMKCSVEKRGALNASSGLMPNST